MGTLGQLRDAKVVATVSASSLQRTRRLVAQGSSRQLGRLSIILLKRCWRIPIYKIGGFSNERPESPCLRNLMLPETPKRSAKYVVYAGF